MFNYSIILNDSFVGIVWQVKLDETSDNGYIAFVDERENIIFSMCADSWYSELSQKEKFESDAKIRIVIKKC